MIQQEQFTIVAKTFYGLENILAQEIKSLGGNSVEVMNRAVSCKGNLEFLYKANLYLRTALKLLKPVFTFKVFNEDQLYKRVKQFKWTDYFNVEDTFAVESVVVSKYFKHSKYVALKVKDAIVDQFRERFNKRPDVQQDNPDFKIHVHIAEDECILSFDSSGDPLFKRGYRKDAGLAPLNEVLAAGLVLMSGWNREVTFIDPMCGSGTLLIEAAMIALNVPANQLRKEFGFMKWNDYNPDLWNKVKTEAKQQKVIFCPRIIGADASTGAIRGARENVAEAGLQDYISIRLSKFEEMDSPGENGFIITNPPYGERINNQEITQLYQTIGSTLKHQFRNYIAWIISSNEDGFKSIGLKHTANIDLYNGQLKCKFRRYQIFEGRMNEFKKTTPQEKDTDKFRDRGKPSFDKHRKNSFRKDNNSSFRHRRNDSRDR